MPVIVGSIVVALAAVGGLITALTLNGGGGNDDEGGTAGSSASESEVAGYKEPDPTKTIEPTECTEPDESYNDPDKIKVPTFKFKNIDSVKACFQAAGWQYEPHEQDENAYGDGTVMRQIPEAGTDVDPKDMPKIELYVSTGNPA
jgi:hypothetical protein